MANIISLFITLGSRLAVISLLTSELGLSAYGNYTALISFCYLLVAISDLGLTLFLSKEVSLNRNKTAYVSELLSIFVLSKLAYSSLLSLSLFVFIDQTIHIIGLMMIFSIIKAADMTIFLSGLERYRAQANITALNAVLFLAMVYLIAGGANILEKLFYANIAATVITALIVMVYLKTNMKINFQKLNLDLLKKVIKKSFPFYFSRIFLNLYAHGSTYFASLVLSLDKVAVYSIVVDLYKFGAALIGRIGGVLYTHLNFTKDFKVLKRVTKWSLGAHVLLLPIVVFLGNQILGQIFDFGTEELHRSSLLLYCSLAMVIFSSYWTYPALTAVDLEGLSNLSVFMASLAYFVSFLSLSLAGWISLNTMLLCIVIFDATLLTFILSIVRLNRTKFSDR